MADILSRPQLVNSKFWWLHQIETFSALLSICAGNSPVPGEIPAKRSVTRSFDFFFWSAPDIWLSKQSWGCWFETPSRPVWWHRNGYSNPLNHAQLNNFDNIWGLIKLYFISSPILFLKSIWYIHGTYYLICSKQHIVYNFKVIGSIPWLYCYLCNYKQVTLQVKGENLLAVPHQAISKAMGVLSTMRTPLVFFGNFQSMYVSYHSRNSADALVMGKSWTLEFCIFKLRPPRCDFSNYAIITN